LFFKYNTHTHIIKLLLLCVRDATDTRHHYYDIMFTSCDTRTLLYDYYITVVDGVWTPTQCHYNVVYRIICINTLISTFTPFSGSSSTSGFRRVWGEGRLFYFKRLQSLRYRRRRRVTYENRRSTIIVWGVGRESIEFDEVFLLYYFDHTRNKVFMEVIVFTQK